MPGVINTIPEKIDIAPMSDFQVLVVHKIHKLKKSIALIFLS